MKKSYACGSGAVHCILASVVVLFLVGCGKPEVTVAHVDAATASVINGKVSFTGQAPMMPVLDMSANPNCERLNKTPRRSEQVVVNKNGTLRNTFVWIKSGLQEAKWNPPAEAVELHQNGCAYEPHVLGLMVGQTLEVLNSDTVNHNIHAEATVNESWNMNEPPRAENRFQRFAKQEVMVPISCGVHPWMRAYLGVIAHPFFAVTGDDGSFSLKRVPPGTYTVEAVHERYGKKELQVTVGMHETKSVEFHYAP